MSGKILAIVLALGMAGGFAASAEQAAPATQAEAAAAKTKALGELMDKAIKLLEEKKYDETITLLSLPADLEKIKADPDRYQQVLKDFEAKKAGPLLANLKLLKEATPKWNEEQTRAEYKTETKPMIFVWVDGRWWLVNK